MNCIYINLKHGKNIRLEDYDDLTRDQLSDNLSALFSINSVVILKTKNTSVIIRPSDISSIEVRSVEVHDDKNIDEDKQQPEEIIPPPKIKPEEPEDIITDID